MVEVNFRSSKYALLFGVINGFIFYLAYQPIKVFYIKYLWSIKNDNYVYVVPPQIYRIASEVGEIFVWTLLFTLASYSVHRYWAKKLKSTVTLWLRVGLVSLCVPVAGLWLLPALILLLILVFELLGVCPYPFNCGVPLNNWQELIIREWLDIKFEAVLLTVALIVNSIYGGVLTKLQKKFEN